jgi:hypothetical protein
LGEGRRKRPDLGDLAGGRSHWQALYERLKSSGYEVCLVHCQAVRNNRKTMQDGTSKTDEKDAASVFD